MENAYKTQNIFISSTFLDMQVERDVLNKRVLPIIKEYGLKYHINIELVDLRFGVDIGTSTHIEKIVSICENEIERCKPLFIGLIGNRYGTVFKDDLSITALEILYSLKKKYNVLFYSRKISNVQSLSEEEREIYFDDEEKIKLLKDRIGVNIKEYEATYNKEKKELEIDNCFIDVLIEDIKRIIDEEYGKNENINLSKYLNYSSYLNSSYISIFSSLEEKLNNIDEINEKIVLLYAPSGYGKSMLLSNAINHLLKQGKTVISYSSQTNSNKGYGGDLLSSYNEELSKLLNLEYNQEDINKELDKFYELISMLDREVVFICDSYESIYFDSSITKTSYLKIDKIPNNVKFLFSTNSKKDLESLKYDSYILTPDLLNKEGIAKYLSGYINRKSFNVSSSFFDKIVSKIDELEDVSLLYVSTLIDYLFYNDRKDAEEIRKLSSSAVLDDAVLSFYLNKLNSSPKSLNELILLLVNKKLELASPLLVEVVFTALSSTKSLKEKDLELLMEKLSYSYLSSDFAYIRYVLKDYFIQNSDGTYSLSHDYIISSLEKEYNSLKIKERLGEVLISIDDTEVYKHASLIKVLYETNKENEIVKAIKDNKNYLHMYTKDILMILKSDMSFLKVLMKSFSQDEYKMYAINYLIEGLDVEFHEEILNTISPNKNDEFYALGLVKSEMKKEHINHELLVDLSSKFTQNIKTYSLDYKLMIVSLLMEVSEYLLEKNEPFGSVRYLVLASGLIKKEKVLDIRCYGKLANIYLKLSHVFLISNMPNFVKQYYDSAIELVNKYHLPSSEIERYINTSLMLFKDLDKSELDLGININEQLLDIATTYRNESKSLEAIYLYLKVKWNYIVTHNAYNNYIKEYLTEIKELSAKSNNPKVELLNALVMDKVGKLLKKEDVTIDKRKSMLIKITRIFRKYKASLDEASDVLFSYIDFFAQYYETNDSSLVNLSELALSIYNDYNRDTSVFRFIKKELYFFTSFFRNNNSEMLLEVCDLALKHYISNPSYSSIYNYSSDVFYYCDSLKESSFEEQLIQLQKLNQCLSHFISIVGPTFFDLQFKIYFYIASTCVLKGDFDLASSYTNKCVELFKSLNNDEFLSCLRMFKDLYLYNQHKYDGSKERKLFGNYIYDLLNNIHPQYLKQLQFTRYDIDEVHSFEEKKLKEEFLDLDLYYNNSNIILPILDLEGSVSYIDFDFTSPLKDNLPPYDFKNNHKEIKMGVNLSNQDPQEIIKYANDLILKNDAFGYYVLYKLYSNYNQQEAIKYLNAGCNSNDPASLYELGLIYNSKNNQNTAFSCFLKAGSLGHYIAISTLLMNYESYLKYYKNEIPSLIEGCKKVVSEDFTSSSSQEALRNAIKLVKLIGENIESYEWIIRFYRLTNFSRNGDFTRSSALGMNKINEEEYYLSIARFGSICSFDPDKMNYLSYAYLLGKGVEVNYKKAEYWANKAKENNDDRMFKIISKCKEDGYGTFFKE